jgi:hypothetical protein
MDQRLEQLWDRVKGGVEATADAELDIVDGAEPNEKIATFLFNGDNYRLTLTKIQPHAGSARTG